MDNLLLDVLSQRLTLAELTTQQWDRLLRSAREAEVTGRIQRLRTEESSEEGLPGFVRHQLDSAAVQMAAQHRAVLYEVEHLEKIFNDAGIPHIYLKGAAYLLAGSANSQGRLFSDIDLLVPESDLHKAEQELRDQGWVSTHANAYDQQYYRRFMHELPPMVHVKRGTVLDLHHNILPRTARHLPDAEQLFATAVTLAGGAKVPDGVDRLLHCASHLFHEGEVKQGVRGLVDIDLLYRELSQQQRQQLLGRAEQLHLQRSLYYGLRYSERYLSTPIDEAIRRQLSLIAPGAPARIAMDWFYYSVFNIAAEEPVSARHLVSEFMVYLRGHYLRMPLYRLLPHLLIKGIKPLQKQQARA
ncbi:nucleotidyltransferase domain-containing protein [Aestuariirhabdus sp. LZHN29]|uniref:nucleotidyltransferase domain-containing protein n=1 Tax=Aestuariirhabdus sp. LZHN29 TaxID=3417462 RepID=UPI003CEF43E3